MLQKWTKGLSALISRNDPWDTTGALVSPGCVPLAALGRTSAGKLSLRPPAGALLLRVSGSGLAVASPPPLLAPVTAAEAGPRYRLPRASHRLRGGTQVLPGTRAARNGGMVVFSFPASSVQEANEWESRWARRLSVPRGGEGREAQPQSTSLLDPGKRTSGFLCL